jgi:histone-lysine N-methyltransferase SETMAR
MDETLIHHYTPKSKQQSKQWTETGCSAPKETRSVPSARKVMASVFWDAEGILFIDYLEKGKTITGEYYFNLLTRLDEKIREKSPSLQKKKIIFHQDNAPAHKSVLAMGKLRDLHYELLEHPPYFPGLASSDFSLPKTQTVPRWSAFFFESRDDCSFRAVFCRSYEEPLQGRDNDAGTSLE